MYFRVPVFAPLFHYPRKRGEKTKKHGEFAETNGGDPNRKDANSLSSPVPGKLPFRTGMKTACPSRRTLVLRKPELLLSSIAYFRPAVSTKHAHERLQGSKRRGGHIRTNRSHPVAHSKDAGPIPALRAATLSPGSFRSR